MRSRPQLLQHKIHARNAIAHDRLALAPQLIEEHVDPIRTLGPNFQID